MALSFTGLTSGFYGNPIPSTSEDTASITPTANRLIIADILSLDSSGLNAGAAPSSLTSTGLTWVKITDVSYSLAGFTTYLSRWRAMGASPSAGVVTIAFPPTGQTDIIWSIYESNGDVDTTGTNGSGAIVQSVTNTGTGTSLAVTLAAFGSADNSALGFFGTENAGSFTVGSGFTQIHALDVSLTEHKLNDTSVDATYSVSGNWAGIATEVKAATAAFDQKKASSFLSFF